MWARISEITLGVWLFISYFLFEYHSVTAIVCACLILIFASLSYIDKLNKMHLFQAVPGGWLLYEGLAYPTPFEGLNLGLGHSLPMELQNYVAVALLLFMFTIIPSKASDYRRIDFMQVAFRLLLDVLYRDKKMKTSDRVLLSGMYIGMFFCMGYILFRVYQINAFFPLGLLSGWLIRFRHIPRRWLGLK